MVGKSRVVFFFSLSLLLSLFFMYSVSAVDVDGDGRVDCSSLADCASGESCVDGGCVAYCDIGETECSDGVDNDGNGYYDYGYCDINHDGTYSSTDDALCSTIISDALSAYGNDFSADSSALAYCDWACTDDTGTSGYYYEGDFIDRDPGCFSPYDTVEVTLSAMAPETVSEEGFFSGLWNWIAFWK